MAREVRSLSGPQDGSIKPHFTSSPSCCRRHPLLGPRTRSSDPRDGHRRKTSSPRVQSRGSLGHLRDICNSPSTPSTRFWFAEFVQFSGNKSKVTSKPGLDTRLLPTSLFLLVRSPNFCFLSSVSPLGFIVPFP